MRSAVIASLVWASSWLHTPVQAASSHAVANFAVLKVCLQAADIVFEFGLAMSSKASSVAMYDSAEKQLEDIADILPVVVGSKSALVLNKTDFLSDIREDARKCHRAAVVAHCDSGETLMEVHRYAEELRQACARVYEGT